MNQSAESRELFSLDDMDGKVQGTFHKVMGDRFGQECDRVAIVFLNGLFATRAGHGDAVAYWADSLAEFGYSCFRLDLPGYGDSPDDPPEDWLDHVNAGGYADIATAKIRELVDCFGLSGVILVGQCAGALTAIFSSSALRECRGLILMEPYFFRSKLPSSTLWQRFQAWRLQNRFGIICATIYRHLKAVRLSPVRGSLPRNANRELLRHWKAIASAGLPILVLQAPKPKEPGEEEFDYLDYIAKISGPTNDVSITVIEGANHTFSNRLGREAVRHQMEAWLRAHFPCPQPEPSIRGLALLNGIETKTTWCYLNSSPKERDHDEYSLGSCKSIYAGGRRTKPKARIAHR